MAALACRFGELPPLFLERFSQELPFAWESVSFSAWKRAVLCLQKQLQSTFGNDNGDQILGSYIDSRLNVVSSLHPALAPVLGIVCAPYKPQAKSEALVLQLIGGTQAHLTLFDGPECEMMKLRQRHADDEWPQGLRPIIAGSASAALIKEVGCPATHHHADSVINLPVALAVDVSTGLTERWFENPAYIHTLRTHYAFDPEWFEVAYHLTIARCLARGLIAI